MTDPENEHPADHRRFALGDLSFEPGLQLDHICLQFGSHGPHFGYQFDPNAGNILRERCFELLHFGVQFEKAVLYRTAAGMKLELYLDITGRGDRFAKVLEYEDRGQWGPTQGGNAECDCGENVVLSMARVAIGYRCDNLIDFQFKDMSIRSIDPSRPLRAEMPER